MSVKCIKVNIRCVFSSGFSGVSLWLLGALYELLSVLFCDARVLWNCGKSGCCIENSGYTPVSL